MIDQDRLLLAFIYSLFFLFVFVIIMVAIPLELFLLLGLILILIGSTMGFYVILSVLTFEDEISDVKTHSYKDKFFKYDE